MVVLGWIVSVAVAFIALISPLISQVTEISKLRQAWINDQRDDIAEFVGLAEEWQNAYAKAEKAHGSDLVVKAAENDARRKCLVVFFRIEMRINPNSNSPTRTEDDFFLRTLQNVIDVDVHAKQGWIQSAEEAVNEGQLLLKREWDVVKTPAYKAMWKALVGR